MRQSEGSNSLRRKDSTKSVARRGQNVDGTQLDRDTFNNVYFTPVPTNGSPTDRLVDRFSGRCLIILANFQIFLFTFISRGRFAIF